MKKILSFVLVLLSSQLWAQSGDDLNSMFKSDYTHVTKRIYRSNASEFIFSGAQLSINDVSFSTIPRFSMFYHQYFKLHYDFSKYFGLYSGLSLRNIGFIYYDDFDSTKYKFRSYSTGIPLAIKLGNLDERKIFYFGGHIEYLFHFKQKDFQYKVKTKSSEWFSKAVIPIQPSVFAGYQYKSLNVTLHYYFNNFLNPDYFSRSLNARPFIDYKSQLYFLSIGFDILHKKKSRPLDILKKQPETEI